MKAEDFFTADQLEIIKHYYKAPGRYYHNWDHIQEMLNLGYFIFGDDWGRKQVAATLFHDAVYTPGSPDNEEASAQLWLTWSKSVAVSYTDSDVTDVACMIRATAHHFEDEVPFDVPPETASFLDIDLARLASNSRILFVVHQLAIVYEHFRGANKRDVREEGLQKCREFLFNKALSKRVRGHTLFRSRDFQVIRDMEDMALTNLMDFCIERNESSLEHGWRAWKSRQSELFNEN
jgi:predicted metal-dependent HD superfamily phosphohydrolase